MLLLRVVGALFLVAVGVRERNAFAQETVASENGTIRRVRGDLYQVQVGEQFTVFLVTSDGIVLADPLDRSSAVWLKSQLAMMFPGRAVRYVLLTGHELARAEGATMFLPDAEIVAHRSFNDEVARARREAAGERYAAMQRVKSEYATRRTVTLGGRTVVLVHPGEAFAPEATILYFESERVVFAVGGPPFDARPMVPTDWKVTAAAEWLRAFSRLEFETMLTGAGDALRAADLIALSRYFDQVIDGVVAGFERGQTLEQLLASSLVRTSSPGPMGATRDVYLTNVYRNLRLVEVQIYGAPIVSYPLGNNSFCDGASGCQLDRAIPRSMSGLRVSIGRFGIQTEFSAGAQAWAVKTSQFLDQELLNRESRVALLLRYGAPRHGPFSYALLGGVAFTMSDAKGMDRVKGALAPFGGRHEIRTSSSSVNWAVGLDASISVSSRLAFVFPVRVFQAHQTSDEPWLRPFDANAGVGMALRLFRKVD